MTGNIKELNDPANAFNRNNNYPNAFYPNVDSSFNIPDSNTDPLNQAEIQTLFQMLGGTFNSFKKYLYSN